MALQRPKVSVIIPCFNASHSLRLCLESVVGQCYAPLEIICVDDGSVDNTVNVAREFDAVQVVKQSNQGACAARNRGVREATGKYIKFLDADDFLFPAVISHQVKLAEQLGEDAITYGNYVMRDEKGDRKIVTKLLHVKPLTSLVLQDITTSTPLHRKHLLEKVDGFDTRLQRGQEWNLHVRLAASGIKFCHDEVPIYTYVNFDDPSRVSRYSSHDRRSKYAYKIKQVELTAETLDRGQYLLSYSASPAFARRLWSAGRDAMRDGDVEIAEECFERALTFCSDTSRFLPFYYRIPSRILGRRRFERLLSPQAIGRLASRIERGLWRRL